MVDKVGYEKVIIWLLAGISVLMLFAKLDQLAGLFHSKALVQEGIDEQIDILLHICNPPLIVQSGVLPTSLPRYPLVKQNSVKLVCIERDAIMNKPGYRN